MNVSLTPELERFVNGKVQTGRYNSASEVVREALRLLEQHEQARAAQLGESTQSSPGAWPRWTAASRSILPRPRLRLQQRSASAGRSPRERYILSPDADQDLTDIWDYIAAIASTPPIAGSRSCLTPSNPWPSTPSLGTSGRTSHRTRFCFGRLDPT